MKRSAIYVAFLLMTTLLPMHAIAQDKPRPDTEAKKEVIATPIKLQIVFTEFDGDKKIKSLPYTIYYSASHAEMLQAGFTKLRIGSRVPVMTGAGQFQYLDVGTNLDARSARAADGHFLVQLNVEHAWVEGETQVQLANADHQSAAASTFPEPIIRSIRSELDLSLRDGQTSEITAATDPISGRVVRVEVTLTVLK